MLGLKLTTISQAMVLKSVACLSLGLTLFSVNALIAKIGDNPLISQNNVTVQILQDYLNIRVADLNQANTLRIAKIDNLNQGYIRGTIRVNGAKIQDLHHQTTSLNLSPKLIPGLNTIEVRGEYVPIDSGLKIELTGVSTSVNQVISGGGNFSYTLNIMVE